MTDRGRSGVAPRRKRLSKRALRVWAWILGAIAFVAPSVAFGLQPKPIVAAPLAQPAAQPRVVQRTLRRSVYAAPRPTRTPRVRYAYSPPTTGSNGGNGRGGGGGNNAGAVATSGGS